MEDLLGGINGDDSSNDSTLTIVSTSSTSEGSPSGEVGEGRFSFNSILNTVSGEASMTGSSSKHN